MQSVFCNGTALVTAFGPFILWENKPNVIKTQKCNVKRHLLYSRGVELNSGSDQAKCEDSLSLS